MIAVTTLTCLVIGVVSAEAQETAFVQGEVVDLSCYVMTGGRSAEYQTCARLHAKQSVTFGVVTDAGELFLLVNQSADRDPYEAAKKLVNIVLGTMQPSACPHGIPSRSPIGIALIIQAVDNALSGCSAP